MDLTKTVTFLAEANQKLAVTNNFTLGYLEKFYLELNDKRSTNNTKNNSKFLVSKNKVKSVNRKSRKLKNENFNSEKEIGTQKITADNKRLKQITEDNELTLTKQKLQIDELINKLNLLEIENKNLQNEKNKANENFNETLNRLKIDKDSKIKKYAEELEESKKETQFYKDKNRNEDKIDFGTNTNPRSSVSPEILSCNTPEIDNTKVSEEFKKELMLKREARQRAIAAVSSEMERLKSELEKEKSAHLETKSVLENLKDIHEKSISNKDDKTDIKTLEHFEAIRLANLLKVSDIITNDLNKQLEKADDLRFLLENEPDKYRLRIISLKKLTDDTRINLKKRKDKVNLLKDKLASILVKIGDRTFLINKDNINDEYDREIKDFCLLKHLSDERSKILNEIKEHLLRELHDVKLQLDNAKKNNECVEEELQKTEEKLDAQDADILNLESQLGLTKADCRDLQNQMSIINSLFTQMLLGASSAEMDLDRLTRLLQENKDLICQMAKEDSTEAAALPKLLLDIIKQVNGNTEEETKNNNDNKKDDDELQEENIALNLPKVWRVLFELLSCHAEETEIPSTNLLSASDTCYKSIDTPAGPRLVISVSKTYIRLKELILEKKHLQKEMNRMKQLNTHLESKLSEQEKRLSTVTDELSKTWNIVDRMQEQHQQLHTHEKILRYELQQKRKMLQELKQELEYCREKWDSARQKNTKTEIEWKLLRKEFAARRAMINHSDSFNNSGESGFSDEREEESEDDEDEESDAGNRKRLVNARRRLRKDDTRAKTPDTESEQQTDNELSESKTVSSEIRTPENESISQIHEVEETELPINIINDDTIETKDENLITTTEENNFKSYEETMNPLDKALTNVIENLMKIEDVTDDNASKLITKSVAEVESMQSLVEIELNKALESENESRELSQTETARDTNEEIIKAASSVFFIGPISSQTAASKNVQFSDPLIVGPSNKVSINEDSKENENSEFENEVKVENSNEPVPNNDVVTECANTEKESTETKTILNDTESLSTLNKSTEDLKISKETELPSSSSTSSSRTQEEILDARAERLKRLEEQANWLVKKMSATNRRGTELNTRLEELHETYSSTPSPPPMPDILPNFKISTDNSNNNVNNQIDNEKKDDNSK